MTGLRRTLLQVLSLALTFTSGLSLGGHIHLWQASHAEHAHHDTAGCPVCQQALANPKLMLPVPSPEVVKHQPVLCLVQVRESRLVPTQRLGPTAPRGPPGFISDRPLF
ncbi:MAG: hypothetical protein GXY55_12540 [Phycisphaerae bacterium]|nr:hypothetical protein [Phycisphaerae bacterium]